jgi:hypothetical protein
MQRRKLPIGLQTFAKMREGNCYYVDKTPFILQLIDQGSHYFLSRPRRFGKSVLLDTIKELFEGRRELFEGLAAETEWDWRVTHPVVHLSFGSGVMRQPAELDASIHQQFSEIEQAHGIQCVYPGNANRFMHLLRELHRQSGRRVVVLIDEYDKPMLDSITEPDTARAMRATLRDLYSVIKAADAHVHFVFITGVSKFSKVSLFSGLNNLMDLTLNPRYSAICGYTDSDVDTVFAPELAGLDRAAIRDWYNGYNWGGEAVYNPYDLLLYFSQRDFQPFWFETGTPTFLVELMARQQFYLPGLPSVIASDSLLAAFDVERMAPEALLFQTGYLTIKQLSQPLSGHRVYTLGYPNREVEASLNAALLVAYGAEEAPVFSARVQLIEAVRTARIPVFKDALSATFASIPHDWYRNSPLARYEGHYASVVYAQFAALGLDTRVEDATDKGRIDLTLRYFPHVYLFEFKVVEAVSTGAALAQLKDRGYASKYLAPGVQVHLIGVEFASSTRSIVGFEYETLGDGATP